MARRIVVTVLALIGALLVTTVIPLGVLATARETQSFQQDTLLSARALAAVAEEGMVDHRANPALALSLSQARRAGESIWVYYGSGELADGTGGRAPSGASARLAQMLQGARTAMWQSDDRLMVAVSLREVLGNGPTGAVVVSRSVGELDEQVRVLWTWLAVVAAAGLLAGAGLAIGIARWVGRPLTALDLAAQRLGGGALDARSATGEGPPEVRRLAANFNTMAGRLELLVHGHRATMADVSHQLRTPLAALRLRLDLLIQDADEGTAAELADAQDEIARLSRLVDGLLAVARAENVVVEPVLVAIPEVIRDRAAAWRPVAEERGITLRTDCPAQLDATLGEGHLEQILDNLLANALDALDRGGEVRVSAQTSGAGVRVSVADNGPGMSAERRESAFRRFASSTGGGAGLGLAIVHRLTTSNGGTAELSATPGGGLTVTLNLPGNGPDRSERARRVAGGPIAKTSIPYQL